MSLDNVKISLRPDAFMRKKPRNMVESTGSSQRRRGMDAGSLTRSRRRRLERHEYEKATLQPTWSLSRVGLE